MKNGSNDSNSNEALRPPPLPTINMVHEPQVNRVIELSLEISQLEAKLKDRVADLRKELGHQFVDDSTSFGMEETLPALLENVKVEHRIMEMMKDRQIHKTNELIKKFDDVSPSTIYSRLSQLVDSKKLVKVDRGAYKMKGR